MLESFNTDKFEYKRLSLEEQEKRGILGRLVGVIADTKNPTRNGRKYSSDLWEKVFNDPIMKEKIDNHIVLGELGHPADREETDMEKVAISLAEQPKLGKDGKIYGVFDILNTKNGQLLKTLCDYGCNIGISSRGSGDIYYDENGDEAVDPDTYVCECWDAVLVPGVAEARLQYVNEALDTKKRNKTLRQRLTEQLERASDQDRKIMREALEDLDINLDEETDVQYIGKEEVSGSSMYQKKDGEYTATYQGDTFTANSEGELKQMLQNAYNEKVNATNEELKDDDGWGETIPDTLEDTFDDIERVIYEVRNARRGSYGIQGSEISDLVAKLNQLADELSVEADDIEYHEDEINEDMPLDREAQRELIGKLKRINELSDDILSYDREYDFNDEEDQLAIDNINQTLANIKKLAADLSVTIDEDCDNKEVTENAGDAGLVNQLQEALAKSAQLEKDNLSLQEQLSVCNAKEVKMEESLSKYKTAMVNLSNSSKENNTLKEELSSVKKELNESKKNLKEKDRLIESTKIELENAIARQVQKPRIDESMNTKVKNLEAKVTKLNEQLNESSKKLEKTTSVAKKYKAALSEAKNMYINAKAEACGISESDIRNKLKESYTFKDIDSICDTLVREKANLSKLPFRINENTRLGFSTKGDYINGGNFNDDDFVSESLLRMINN